MVRPAPTVVRKVSASKSCLLDDFLAVLLLAMALPAFLILGFVRRVVAFDLSLAGTPYSCVDELRRMAGCSVLDSSTLNRRGHFYALACGHQAAEIAMDRGAKAPLGPQEVA